MKKTFYKFRNWENNFHKKVLTDSELFFSNNFSFNDPFDLQLPILFSGTRHFDRQSFVKAFFEENNIYPNEQVIQIANANWIKVQEDNPQINEDGKKNMKLIAKSIEDKLGILCLSNNYSSTLMWGHYANCHKGFCVGLDPIKLLDFLKVKFGRRVLIKDVNYSDKIPTLDFSRIKILPTDDNDVINDYTSRRFFTKFTDWKYEEETRILIGNYANQALTFPEDILKSVIFGYAMPDNFKKEIIETCNEKHGRVEFFQANLSIEKFEMKIKKHYA